MKKLNLKELELKLPKIDENFSKILLGGDSYGEYGDRNEQNSGPTGPLYDPSDPPQGPFDFDNQHDLDTSLDGCLDDEGGDEVGGGVQGSNSGTLSDIEVPQNLLNGVNLNGNNLFIDLSQGNQIFNSQVNGILASNSVIAGLIEGATQNDNVLGINIGQLQPGSTSTTSTISANTSASQISEGFQMITIDSDLVTSTGTYDLNYTDYTGLDHSELTPIESLVAILAHEAFHAYSNYGFYNSQLNGSTYEERMNWMLNNGYSQEIVDIYYTTTIVGGNVVVTVNDPNDFEQNEHDYMATDSFTLVDEAIAEFRADQEQAEQFRNNLINLIDLAESNLGGGVDPDGGQGAGPTNEQLQQIYDNLLSQLESFLHQFGWMLPQ